ncbi:MAG TPA: hypothetical protein HPP77_10450 [Candidatus Hydrogenedentes bacterium]|nr:hypothetical protein [Candidatus Hydrogenedentota bacterium]HIJ73324.1 hypothetical protein [Candidatus Hydrogenedentota bacterium]
MAIAAIVFSGLLFIPYIGWGVYTLRLRYRYHEDLPFALEGITVVAVIIFCVFEVQFMSAWMETNEVPFLFAILGLVVSGAALYGHMIVSMASQLLVDMVMPDDQRLANEPYYGPAEALERQGDYEGAAREYMVIARVFPKTPTAAIRAGDNLMKLGRPAEATPWFERALRYLDSPQHSLRIANRLFEVYYRDLEQPQEARRVLQNYLSKFPNAEYSDSVRRRLEDLESMLRGSPNV